MREGGRRVREGGRRVREGGREGGRQQSISIALFPGIPTFLNQAFLFPH